MTKDEAVILLCEHFSEGMVRTIVDAIAKDEALRLALEALESTGENDGYHGIDQYFDNVLVDKAITALRLAIDVENMASKSKYKEQLETKDEPVAWGMETDGLIYDVICPDEHEREEGEYNIPLYTHPKEWVGLTEDEIHECFEECCNLKVVDPKGGVRGSVNIFDVGMAIEAKLKEKNGY